MHEPDFHSHSSINTVDILQTSFVSLDLAVGRQEVAQFIYCLRHRGPPEVHLSCCPYSLTLRSAVAIYSSRIGINLSYMHRSRQ